MSNSKLFGVIVCDSHMKWGGAEGIAKRVQALFEVENATWKIYVAERNEFPNEEELHRFQGFYITGSQYSVNDDTVSWIKELQLFIQRVYFNECISKALGGTVGNNPSKRFVCHNEAIVLRETDENGSKFLNDLRKISQEKPFRVLQSHGECIHELPINAKNVASSNSCKYEIVLYGDNIIGAQAHADFCTADLTDVILPSLLEKKVITQEEADFARESFKTPNACSDLVIAIREFLNSE